ncbi:MAG: hypothetical protein V1648_04600 [Candidatus Aenigmatarchaeota archaeon]
MQYRPELILLVNFGEYNQGRKTSPAVDLIPLLDFGGLGYAADFLANPEGLKNLAPYDRRQIDNVIDAYKKFDVKIKCVGKYGECKEPAQKVALAWEHVHKHEKQSGPEIRVQLDVKDRPFYCGDCAEEFKYNISDGNTMEFPINFGILGSHPQDWNLDRTRLHMALKKIAYQLIEQTADDLIDTSRMKKPERMEISNQQAKKIVNRLLRAPVNMSLFGKEEYTERPLYRITRNPRCG